MQLGENRGPRDVLGRLAASLERLAGRGVATATVHGTTEAVQAEFPEVDFRALVKDALMVLGRLLNDAAKDPAGETEAWTERQVRAAVRGVVAEVHDRLSSPSPKYGQFFDRLGDWLQTSLADLQSPELGVRLAAATAVEAAVHQLQQSRAVLRPVVAELAEEAGRGLVKGFGARPDELSRLVARLVDRAARSLVHGVTGQVETELHRHKQSETGGEVKLRQVTHDIGAAFASGIVETLRQPTHLAAIAGGTALLLTLIVGIRGR